MIRKNKLCVAILSICVMLSACGHEPIASTKALTNAKNAANIGQEYLDGSISYHDAIVLLDDIYENLDYVSNYTVDERLEDKQKYADDDLHAYILILQSSINSDGWHGDVDSFNKVQDNLDKLNKLIKKYD